MTTPKTHRINNQAVVGHIGIEQYIDAESGRRCAVIQIITGKTKVERINKKTIVVRLVDLKDHRSTLQSLDLNPAEPLVVGAKVFIKTLKDLIALVEAEIEVTP